MFEYLFKFDNSEFLNELEERGFNVITDSKSNYGGTYTSLPSLLNMKYLDDYRGKVSDSIPSENKRGFFEFDMVPI